MVGYKIYLTKSYEVAHLISDANSKKLNTVDDKGGKVACTSAGMVHEDCRIPRLYHNAGWFYSLIEYRELESPRYEIVFA